MSGQREREPVYHVATFPSALGWMAVRWRDGAVSRLVFGYSGAEAALVALEAGDADRTQLPPEMRGLVRRLTAYAEGAEDDFRDVAVDDGQRTKFQRSVLEQCRNIRRGEVLSYAQLALLAGSPNSARAVGNVMAHNRIPLIIPCHRVVGSRGALGGFSAPDGIGMKRRLLSLEGSLAAVESGPQPVAT